MLGISCSDQNFPLLDHEQVCDLARLLSFDAIDLQLCGERSRIKPADVRAAPQAWARRVGESLSKHDMLVADIFFIASADYTTMAVNHPSEGERRRGAELFGAALGFAAAVGSPGMTVMPGMEFEGVSHEASLERAAQELRLRCRQAGDIGLQISVEPHIRSVIQSPADIGRLLDMVPDLQVTLDHSHILRQGLPQFATDGFAPRVRHYHARCTAPNRLQVPMRENELDFETAVEHLSAIGYVGYFAVEYTLLQREDIAELDVLSETILLRDRLRAAIATVST